MLLRRRLAGVLAPALLLLLAPAAALAGPGDTTGEAIPINNPGTQLGPRYSNDGDNFGVDDAADYFCGSANFGREQWYRFHPHRPGRVSADLSSSDFFTVVVITPYDPATGTPDFTTSRCNSETTAVPDKSFVNDFDVVEGGSYYVMAGSEDTDDDGHATGAGNYTLGLSYDPDTDRDGLRDSVDACDNQPGPASNGGCPPPAPRPDRDNDGVFDDGPDKCLNENSRARDVNANGCLDLGRLGPKFIYDFDNTPSGVKLAALTVTKAPKGTDVRVRCTRHACRKAHKRVRKGRATFLRKKRLRAGTKVVVIVTRRLYVGSYATLTVTRNGIRKRELCLKPGTTRRPLRCSRVSTLR